MGDEKDINVNAAQANLSQHLISTAGAGKAHLAAHAGAVSGREASAENAQSSPNWGQWLTENGARMLLFARQQSRSAEDAEDILQEALVKLARKVQEGSFEGGQDSWRPFLYTTIRRLAIDLGRKNDRRSKREKKSEADRQSETGGISDPWFHSDSSNEEARSLLEVELKKLPAKFSEVIILKVWGNHTFAEIGEMLGVSLNTVASRYRYGLERLRRALENNRARNDI
ncbi:MAG: RNA polymerase sigma factor [Akkermansiaceae bacterium]